MENPNTWNAVMKVINNFDWDYETVSDEVANNLINCLEASSLLTSKPEALHSVVIGALQQHIKELNKQICGFSIGASLYYKLKEINAVQ